MSARRSLGATLASKARCETERSFVASAEMWDGSGDTAAMSLLPVADRASVGVKAVMMDNALR
jgi:hypothetical protein